MYLSTRYTLSIMLALSLLLAGCQQQPSDQSVESAPIVQETTQAPLSSEAKVDYTFAPGISAEDFVEHVKVLSSDEFEGRSPGSIGETKTVEYLTAQFKRLGLAPGNGESYVQEVPVVETTIDEKSTTLSIKKADAGLTAVFGTDYVLGSRTGQADVSINDSQLVFVGYGVVAPEENWNDYAGLDVKGKTVVMLVNDPGFHVASDIFAGRKMTYYGRWTYKYEEAARQGAAAALIIHDTEGAGYGWDVVKNSWSGPQFDLPASEDPEPRLPAQGWISAEFAQALFAAEGQDFAAMRKAASEPGFKPVAFQSQLQLAMKNSTRQAVSHNVLAKLSGSKYPDEAIVYTAHWDHLGKEVYAGEQPAAGQDLIYNGAIDNATGVAGVLEIAESFVTLATPPERSVIFLLVTLEESGLLGSKYYAAHPPVALANTVAVVNLDAMTVVGQTKDFVVIGLGNSELDDIARKYATEQNRVLVEESSPEKGFFFRSDHFSFAKGGVPALYGKGGIDHIEKGKAFGQQMLDDYTQVRYHKTADNYDPSWDLRGVLDDLKLLYSVGNDLAQSRQWPNYVEGNAFRAPRDASRAALSK